VGGLRGSEEAGDGRAGILLDSLYLVDFSLRDRCRFGYRIETGNTRPPDRLDRLDAVDRRQEGLDVDAVASIGCVCEGVCIGWRTSF
jgi:hypothetical protein